VTGTCTENGGFQNNSSGKKVRIKGLQEKSQDSQEKKQMDIIKRDLKDMNTSWKEAKELAKDRAEWRQRVARSIHQDAG